MAIHLCPSQIDVDNSWYYIPIKRIHQFQLNSFRHSCITAQFVLLLLKVNYTYFIFLYECRKDNSYPTHKVDQIYFEYDMMIAYPDDSHWHLLSTINTYTPTRDIPDVMSIFLQIVSLYFYSHDFWINTWGKDIRIYFMRS